MTPIAIGVLVFATAFIGALALLSRAPEREAVAVRLREVEQHRAPRTVTLSLPFYRRALIPFIKTSTDMVTRLAPPKSIALVRSRLEQSGQRYRDPLMWILLKWLGTAAGAGAAYAWAVWQRWPIEQWAPVAIGLAGIAYLWPEMKIRMAIERRQARILKELPETLDLLTIAVEAGLGLDQALSVVAARRPGPLSDEIRAYLDEVGLGMERKEALRAVGRRTGLSELVSLTSTLVQAMEFGVSIATVLRVQAEEVRVRRRQRIEERAMKAPVKMLFPLIFLIMPAVFVVTAGPGLIRVYTEFIGNRMPSQFRPPAEPGR
ncbi:MAG: type II secretion system F family protein [Armatimonadota bacterium]|nr:type II secretion system F family protein [Armatimonadota bacterium]